MLVWEPERLRNFYGDRQMWLLSFWLLNQISLWRNKIYTYFSLPSSAKVVFNISIKFFTYQIQINIRPVLSIISCKVPCSEFVVLCVITSSYMRIIFIGLLYLFCAGLRWTFFSDTLSDPVAYQILGPLSMLISLHVNLMFLEWFIEVDSWHKIHTLQDTGYKLLFINPLSYTCVWMHYSPVLTQHPS